MSIFINPGSKLPTTPVGWTNTQAGARLQAAEWLARMHAEGFGDIEVTETGTDGDRWAFAFQHTVTGVVVELSTHGIDDMDAYLKQAIFDPRVYWNGSSCSNPQMENFAAPGYVMTFRAIEGGQ